MKQIFWCCVILFFFSCGKKEKEGTIPSSVLSKEKMADVIMQIHLEEARINLSAEPATSANTKINIKELIKKNNLSQEQYDSSMTFYLNHPLLLNKVYEITLSELTKKQTEMSAK